MYMCFQTVPFMVVSKSIVETWSKKHNPTDAHGLYSWPDLAYLVDVAMFLTFPRSFSSAQSRFPHGELPISWQAQLEVNQAHGSTRCGLRKPNAALGFGFFRGILRFGSCPVAGFVSVSCRLFLAQCPLLAGSGPHISILPTGCPPSLSPPAPLPSCKPATCSRQKRISPASFPHGCARPSFPSMSSCPSPGLVAPALPVRSLTQPFPFLASRTSLSQKLPGLPAGGLRSAGCHPT